MKSDQSWPWPPLDVYALFVNCPTCWAKRGAPCNTKVKPFHVSRQDRGGLLYKRDVGRAPWSDERVPGTRYDSLGEFWNPEAGQ